jgi:hypothetical protein
MILLILIWPDELNFTKVLDLKHYYYGIFKLNNKVVDILLIYFDIICNILNKY